MSERHIRRSRPARSIVARSGVLPLSIIRSDTSRQIHIDDEFEGVTTASWILPPYDPRFLEACRERSNMLAQCIGAMVTNVAMPGYDVVPTRTGVTVSAAEKEELESFVESANSEESLVTVNAKLVDDYEWYGYAFLEVVRDRMSRITVLRHMKAGVTRLMPRDEEPQPCEYKIKRGSRTAYVTEYRTFRRYVQIVRGKTRYFKEFGDMRRLNMETGEYDPTTPDDKQATEVIHFKQTSNESYGVPRWINQLPSVLGSRESEECNLRYFEDNTVPPAILSIAGGRLTGQSYRELTNLLQNQGVGKERQNKILLIEAVPEREGLDDKGNTIQVKLEKLSDARQSDGLFRDYDESNQAKVRSSFRLPPTAVGLSQDVTFATANVSTFVAESQVYAPERQQFDETYNKKLVNGPFGLALRTCKLASRVPAITNPEMLVKSLTALNVMGAITPRMANEMANKVLQLEVPPYPAIGEDGYEEWMDKPIVFVTRGTASQDGQDQKDAKTKQIEGSGDVSPASPEHGQE